MSEQRSEPRIGVQFDVELTTAAGRRLRARTENLSLHGAMLSLRVDPPLSPGERLTVEFSLPEPDAPEPRKVRREATVRWASEILPDMLGIAFDVPLGSAEARLVGGLLPAG